MKDVQFKAILAALEAIKASIDALTEAINHR